MENYTYHNLLGFVQNKDSAVVKGGKDSSKAIMKKSDHVSQLQTMVYGGIT